MPGVFLVFEQLLLLQGTFNFSLFIFHLFNVSTIFRLIKFGLAFLVLGAAIPAPDGSLPINLLKNEGTI